MPEYADAFKSIRAARCWFAILVLLPILVYLASFILVEFTTVLDDEPMVVAAGKPAAATQEAATQAAATQAAPKKAEPYSIAKTVRCVLGEVLPAMRFLAVVAGALLALTLLLAFWTSLVGQLGGVSSFVSAFFWSLILLVLLTPWDQVFTGCWAVPALFSGGLDHVKSFKMDFQGKWGDVPGLCAYYGRFIAYPVLALLVWLIAVVKFGRGYKRMDFPTVISMVPLRPPGPNP